MSHVLRFLIFFGSVFFNLVLLERSTGIMICGSSPENFGQVTRGKETSSEGGSWSYGQDDALGTTLSSSSKHPKCFITPSNTLQCLVGIALLHPQSNWFRSQSIHVQIDRLDLRCVGHSEHPLGIPSRKRLLLVEEITRRTPHSGTSPHLASNVESRTFLVWSSGTPNSKENKH